MVTWENYEEYMILYVDGALNEADQKALLKFIHLHPELQGELKMYQSTVMMPDTTQVYANKEALLKPIPSGKIISIGNWRMYSAAAAVALIIWMAARWMQQGSTKEIDVENVVANENTLSPTTSNHLQPPPTTSNHLQPLPATSSHKASVIRRGESISIARHNVHSNTKDLVKEDASSNKTELETIKPISYEPENVVIETIQIDPIHITVSNEPLQDSNKEEQKENFLAWLPVESEKKEGLRGLKENISAKVEQAKIFQGTIKETALALKIGNKEFTINF